MAYTLNDEQIASVKTFIGKIPDSLIKSRCEKWLEEVVPTKKVTTEQMEQFVGFSTHLPQDVQHFPQEFSMAVKNNSQIETNAAISAEAPKSKEPVETKTKKGK